MSKLDRALWSERQSQAGKRGSRAQAKKLPALSFGRGGTPGKVRAPTVAPIEAAPTKARTLLQLEPNDCRWPVGKGPAWSFCGKPKVDGRSYCEVHVAEAYVKPGARRL